MHDPSEATKIVWSADTFMVEREREKKYELRKERKI